MYHSSFDVLGFGYVDFNGAGRRHFDRFFLVELGVEFFFRERLVDAGVSSHIGLFSARGDR